MPLTTRTLSASTALQGASAALRHSFFRSVDAAGEDWDQAAPAENIFLQRKYLSILENNPPEGMRFGYLVFYLGNQPAGVAVCQIKNFKGDNNIQEIQEDAKNPCFFNALAQWFKKWVAGMMTADILICGNMLLTGDHAYYFNEQLIRKEVFMPYLEETLVSVQQTMERDGVKIPVILVKDISPAHRSEAKHLVKRGFVEFEIQPSMIMPLPYASFDEYLGAMSTKYRTRAKRAFKKAEGIVKKELSLADTQRELPRIYTLYREIAKNAGFNMVDLNENYLLALKRDLAEQFRIFGYYIDGQLMAFYTTICNHRELEAHFLGYDKALNHDFQLYLNILYDIIRHGIERCCSDIVFARTALEIKSSVGAVAHDYYCYLRHQNSIANHFTAPVLDYLKPVEQWVPRHPFKDE